MNKESNLSIKHQLQDWITKPNYKFMMTIQCDKTNEMSETELNQRLRILDYRLNKKFLINRFTSLPLQNRFWCMGFNETDSDGVLHQHILVFTPDENSTSFSSRVSPLEINFIAMDLLFSWYSIPSLKPNGFKRKIQIPHIMKIDKKRKQSVVRYVSKQIQSNDLSNMNFSCESFDNKTTELFV